MKRTLVAIVDDKPGVLARVSSMIAKRAFNIHSLAVGPTQQPGRSRITLVVDAPELEQLTKQLRKLVNVIKVQELKQDEALEREIMLVRVTSRPTDRGKITDTAAMFQATTVDIGPASVTFSVTGSPDVLERFLELMRPYGIAELVKSGRIALSRDTRALRATG